jgi:hypothetical protein
MRILAGVVLVLILLTPASAQQNQPIPMQPPSAAGLACGACRASLVVGLHEGQGTADADTVRRQAIEYSDAYATRLKIHQLASYTEIPLFVAEYLLGEKLLRDQRNGINQGGEDGGSRSSARGAHSAVAGGLGVLFAVNTVTGGWNLYESRKDPAGRTRKWIHTIAMLAADAGFLWTAAAAEGARESDAGARTHRTRAIASMSLATASTLMMWLWKD